MALLTDLQLKKARYKEPGTKTGDAAKSGPGRKDSNKLNDGDGLVLRLKSQGTKLWQFRYRYPQRDPATGEIIQRENTLSFGCYPEVPLASRDENGIHFRGARELAAKARELLAQGIDPATTRDLFRWNGASMESFEAVAREWFAKRKQVLVPGYSRTTIERLEKNVFPVFGARHIADNVPIERTEDVCYLDYDPDHPFGLNVLEDRSNKSLTVENIVAGITTKDNIWAINTEMEYHEEKDTK